METKVTGQEERGARKVYQKQSSKMVCPVCGEEVDYLLGDDNTETGERKACEGCYVPIVHELSEERAHEIAEAAENPGHQPLLEGSTQTPDQQVQEIIGRFTNG